MSLVTEIESRMQGLKPSVCVCDDESHLHVGHAGNKGGGHSVHRLCYRPGPHENGFRHRTRTRYASSLACGFQFQ